MRGGLSGLRTHGIAGRQSTAKQSPPRRWAAITMAVAVVGSACGTRVPYDQLLAASQVRTQPAGSTAGAGQPTQSAPTAPAAAGTPSAGVTGGGNATGGANATGAGSATDGDIATGGTQGPACTGHEAPLILGSVGQQSGLLGFITAALPRATQAWVAMINAKGGLDCHPVKYIVADDGGDPARNQALVEQLVQQDGVVAFVNFVAPLSSSGSVSYINAHRIPVIGGTGIEQGFYQSPYYFPQESFEEDIFRAALSGVANEARARGLVRLGVIGCIEISFCKEVRTIALSVAPQYGLQVVYSGSGSLVQPDYSSLCQDAQAKNAQLLFVLLDPNGIERLAQNCNSVGYHPVFATGSIVATNPLATDPLLDGMIVGEAVAPWMATSIPGVAEFVQALQQFAPGFAPSGPSIAGWASAKMLELAGQHLSNPPTSQDILNGLWSFHSQDFGGLTMPMTFTKDQPAPKAICFWMVTAAKGKWTAPNTNRTCK